MSKKYTCTEILWLENLFSKPWKIVFWNPTELAIIVCTLNSPEKVFFCVANATDFDFLEDFVYVKFVMSSYLKGPWSIPSPSQKIAEDVIWVRSAWWRHSPNTSSIRKRQRWCSTAFEELRVSCAFKGAFHGPNTSINNSVKFWALRKRKFPTAV